MNLQFKLVGLRDCLLTVNQAILEPVLTEHFKRENGENEHGFLVNWARIFEGVTAQKPCNGF